MIKFMGVGKSFGNIKVLQDVSFEINDGEFVFLTGPSGAGKTTLLRLFLKEFGPTEGKIVVDDVDVTNLTKNEIPAYRQKIGVVFQDFKILPERTVRENIEVVLAVAGVDESEWKERVNHVLDLVGLRKKANLFPNQLSGGEMQRASLARALVVNPKIILADEPTGNLDWETADGLMDLFERINKEGKTILMATHNQNLVKKMDKREIKILEGKVVSKEKFSKVEKEEKKEENEEKEKK